MNRLVIGKAELDITALLCARCGRELFWKFEIAEALCGKCMREDYEAQASETKHGAVAVGSRLEG